MRPSRSTPHARFGWRRLAAGLIPLAAGLTLTSGAAAAVPDPGAGCPPQPVSQAFLAWGDPAQYFLAADGDFASRTAWSLAGGAAVVPGGDGFSLAGAPASTASLALPAGSSATSPSNCLSVADPTLRFMARNVGDPASTLLVHANIVAPGGPVYTVPVGVMSAAATWNPGPIMGLLANVLAPSHGGTSTVSFTFTPLGAGGSWQIDDLHIDPWSFGG